MNQAISVIESWFRKPVLYPAELRAHYETGLFCPTHNYRLLWERGANVPTDVPPKITPRADIIIQSVQGAVGQSPIPKHRSTAHTLAVIWLVVVLLGGAACSSPTSPSAVSSGFLGASPAATTGPGDASVSGSPAPMPPSLTSPVCPVTDEDVHHARRLLRILTGELQRGITLSFAMEEIPLTSPRELHGFLNYGPAGQMQQLTSAVLEKNALKFGSPQAAGYALWNASGELAMIADIYVNGAKVTGCTARTGKITGRIDLDGL